MGNITASGVLGFLAGTKKKADTITAKTKTPGTSSKGSSGGTKQSAVYNRESDPYFTAARDAALAAADVSTAPEYKNSYQGLLAAQSEKINNAKPFSYDMNTDPLFLQYRDSYMKSAKINAEDSLGKAAALTGGYGSSYAGAQSRQSYDESMTKLYDRLPGFYSQKYKEYSDRLEREKDEYKRLKELSDDEYKQYTDALKAWQSNRDFYAKREDEAFNRGIKTV